MLEKNELLRRMVEIALPIAAADPLGNDPTMVYRLAQNTLRKNLMRVQSVAILNGYDKMSDSALEIARNIIEDAISLSYVLSDDTDGPEEQAHKFFEYRHVQAKQDLDYYSKLPDYMGEDLNERRDAINREYERVLEEYPEFKNKDGSHRHSWSKNGVEGMADILRKRGCYSKAEIRNMLRVYRLGSRKVHFNPEDLLNLRDQEAWDRSSVRALEYSIKGTAAGFVSVVVRYFDTVRHYDTEVDDSKLEVSKDLLTKIFSN